jgi:hypothetical protein
MSPLVWKPEPDNFIFIDDTLIRCAQSSQWPHHHNRGAANTFTTPTATATPQLAHRLHLQRQLQLRLRLRLRLPPRLRQGQ